MSSLKLAIPALGLLLGGCYYASNEELFPTSSGDTLRIGSAVACVYPRWQEGRYQVERSADGEKSQYRFKGGMLPGPRLVAFHKVGANTWIYVAKPTTIGRPESLPYFYGVIRSKGTGEFDIVHHEDALRDQLAATHGVEVRERVLVGDVINQKRFLLALAAEPGEVLGTCTSN